MNGSRRNGPGARWGRLLICALIGALCLALGGCAARMAYRDGQTHATEGQLPQALERFEEASRLEPGSAEYRIAALRTRERLIALRLARAEHARAQGELGVAEQELRLALTLNGADDRALQGLRLLDQQRRWEQQLSEAQTAADKKDWDGVRSRLQPLLLESPKHPRARELLKQAEQARLRPAGNGAAPDQALAEAYRKPISIEFRDTALKTIFEVISRSAGLNIVFDKDVRSDQKSSIYLKNSSVEAAVKLVLVTNQLESRVLDAHTLLIYPNTPAKQKDYQALTVRSFYLANADAKVVANTLKSLLKLRDAVVDDKLNLLIVRDTPEAIRVAEKLVALHDVPEAEVMLEVEILEVKRTRLLDLGVRWPDQLSLTPLPAAAGGALTLADLRGLNSSSLSGAIGSMSINARKTDTDANILANPRIRARNREKAKIHIGERVPNITTTSTSTGFVSESVNYVDVGLKLDVEPTIYLDNEVAIKVSMEVSSIISQIQTKSGTLAYQIGTRTASTVLRLKDGENQVLAGLISDEDRRSANKVPGLGEVPLLGRLFGNQADDSSKTEIVLSITPRVLRNLPRPEAAAQEFDSGTEANAGARGVETTASAAAPAAQAAPASPAAPAAALTPAAAPGTASGADSANPAAAAAALVPSTVAGAAVSAPVAASHFSLRWDGPSTARVGEAVSLQLVARSEVPITALPLVLKLDPAVLQVMGIAEGGFMRQGGATSSLGSEVDSSGRVQITLTRQGSTGATAEAALVGLTLKLLAQPASGETKLEVLSASPAGLAGKAAVPQLPAPWAISVRP